MKKYIIVTGVFVFTILALFGCRHSSKDASPTAPQTVTLRYAAMGASDAVGTCANPMTQYGYVYQIRDGLAAFADRVEFQNLGILGARIALFEAVELPNALAFQPTLVTIWVGGNDFMAQTPAVAFEAALANILAQLHAQPSLQIVIANLPDMMQLPRVQEMNWNVAQRQQAEDLLEAYNVAIARQAAQYGAHLVDLYSTNLVANPENICQDGFHPSNAGYTRMAELFLDVIGTLF